MNFSELIDLCAKVDEGSLPCTWGFGGISSQGSLLRLQEFSFFLLHSLLYLNWELGLIHNTLTKQYYTW